MSEGKTQIEICVEDAADVALVQSSGADRVELCRELWCGGLTPTDSQVLLALEHAPAGGIRLLIREREHGFALTREEVDLLVAQIEHFRKLTSHSSVPVGYVAGSITAEQNGEIDLPSARKFKNAAGEAPIVFHRAFDEVADPTMALGQLIELGYTGVLTTGGSPTANTQALKSLVEQASGRIDVIASGGVRAHNVVRVLQQTGAPEVHMRAPLEDSTATDPTLVAAIVAQVREANQYSSPIAS